VRDGFGDVLRGEVVSFDFDESSGNESTDLEGTASFEVPSVALAGSYEVIVSVTNADALRIPVTVVPATAAELVVVGGVRPFRAGADNAFEVRVVDAYGNIRPGDADSGAVANRGAPAVVPSSVTPGVDGGPATFIARFTEAGYAALDVTAAGRTARVQDVELLPAGCGDGDLSGDEACDDGNVDPFDTCRADCTLPVCGDGLLQRGEECDDGANDGGDGCSARCRLEQCGGVNVYPATPATVTHSVTNLSDSGTGSLRAVIAGAPAGAVIDFTVSGTIALASELVLTRDVELRGPGAGLLTLDGQALTPIFRIEAGVAVRVSGLRMYRGLSTCGDNCAEARSGNGGCVWNEGDATFADVTVERCENLDVTNSGRCGGAFHVTTSGTLTLVASTLTQNRALYRTGGAAVCSFGTFRSCGTAYLTNATIDSPGGGSLWLFGPTVLDRINISGSSQINSSGGAIEVSGAAADVTIRNSVLTSNIGGFQGGAIAKYGAGTLSIESSTIVGNRLFRNGSARLGAVFSDGGVLRIRDSVIAQNQSDAVVSDDVTAPDVVSGGRNVIGSGEGTTGWDTSDRFGTYGAPLLPAMASGRLDTGLVPYLLPAPDSGLVDAANVTGGPSIDLRGFARPSGSAPDIGAAEVRLPAITSTSITLTGDELELSATIDPRDRAVEAGFVLAAPGADGRIVIPWRFQRSATPQSKTFRFARPFPASQWTLVVSATNPDGTVTSAEVSTEGGEN